jgi:hypothetical protein
MKNREPLSQQSYRVFRVIYKHDQDSYEHVHVVQALILKREGDYHESKKAHQSPHRYR